MSEGTPGRGPDADTRTDAGAEQGAPDGRPTPPPVRYGPRNGSPRNGSGGRPTADRPGPSSPQQYRSPQPTPPTAAPNGSTDNGGNGSAHGTSANGNGAHAAGANGSGANGTGANGTQGPASYSRPRPAGRLAPSEQDRAVADARTAAAARNASANKVRGGSALLGGSRTGDDRAEARPQESTAAADDTAVTPVVGRDGVEEQGTADSGTTTTTAAATPAAEKTAGLRGLFRERRPKTSPTSPGAGEPQTATATTPGGPGAPGNAPAGLAKDGSESQAATPADGSATASAAASHTLETTQERPLTWRDRLGIAPKAPKPQPVVVPDSGPGVPTAAAAAAVAASVAAGSTPPETKASPTGPTTPPDVTGLQAPATPATPVPTTSDTVVIPVVEAGAVGPTAPAAAATAQPLVAAKAKVGLARRTRKARLRLSRVDPWSVMKTAFLFSIAAGIILVVATYGVWSVLNASGLFAAVDDMVKSVVSTPGDTTPFRIEEYVNTQKVLGLAAILAVIDVLIFTALATLGSFLYNLAATVLGGLEVTLAED